MAKQSACDRIMAGFAGQQAPGPYGGPSNIPMPRSGGLFSSAGGAAGGAATRASRYMPSGPGGLPTTGRELAGMGILAGLRTFKKARQQKLVLKDFRRGRRIFAKDKRVRLPEEKRAFTEAMATRGRGVQGTQYKRGIRDIQHPWDVATKQVHRQRKSIRDAKKFSWLWG